MVSNNFIDGSKLRSKKGASLLGSMVSFILRNTKFNHLIKLIMEQTFRRTIGGDNLQFNRLLYPLRYAVKSDEDESTGEIFEFKKDRNSNWTPVVEGGAPDWLKNNLNLIAYTIEINESILEPIADF